MYQQVNNLIAMITVAAFALAGCLAVGASSSDQHSAARPGAAPFRPRHGLRRISPWRRRPRPGVVRLSRPANCAAWRAPPASRSRTDGRHLRDATGGHARTRPRSWRPCALALPEARIEMLDFSHRPVPEGRIEFPLARPARQERGWGDVRYGGEPPLHHLGQGKGAVQVRRVVAARELCGRGSSSTRPPSGWRLSTRDDSPSPDATLIACRSKSDREMARAAIRGRGALDPRRLARRSPRLVARGDTVQVEVRERRGRTRTGRAGADGSGAGGETIPVLNPATGKRFRARDRSTRTRS